MQEQTLTTTLTWKAYVCLTDSQDLCWNALDNVVARKCEPAIEDQSGFGAWAAHVA